MTTSRRPSRSTSATTEMAPPRSPLLPEDWKACPPVPAPEQAPEAVEDVGADDDLDVAVAVEIGDRRVVAVARVRSSRVGVVDGAPPLEGRRCARSAWSSVPSAKGPKVVVTSSGLPSPSMSPARDRSEKENAAARSDAQTPSTSRAPPRCRRGSRAGTMSRLQREGRARFAVTNTMSGTSRSSQRPSPLSSVSCTTIGVESESTESGRRPDAPAGGQASSTRGVKGPAAGATPQAREESPTLFVSSSSGQASSGSTMANSRSPRKRTAPATATVCARLRPGRETRDRRRAERNVGAGAVAAVAVDVREEDETEGAGGERAPVGDRDHRFAAHPEQIRIGRDAGRVDRGDDEVGAVRHPVEVRSAVVSGIEVGSVRAVVGRRGGEQELRQTGIESGGQAQGRRALERGGRGERHGGPGDPTRRDAASVRGGVEVDSGRQVEGHDHARRVLAARIGRGDAREERRPGRDRRHAVGDRDGQIGSGEQGVDVARPVVGGIGIGSGRAVVSDGRRRLEGPDARRHRARDSQGEGEGHRVELAEVEDRPDEPVLGDVAAVARRQQHRRGR